MISVKSMYSTCIDTIPCAPHCFKITFSYLIFYLRTMPPKKDTAPEPKPLIGRVGTNLKVGIVGLPNVGNVNISDCNLCQN